MFKILLEVELSYYMTACNDLDIEGNDIQLSENLTTTFSDLESSTGYEINLQVNF